MSRTFEDHIQHARTGVKFGMGVNHAESGVLLGRAKGVVIFELHDGHSGDLLHRWERPNLITKDGGVLAARLFKDSLQPNTAQNNGLVMLAVGTGATGNLLSPDAPQTTQRKLNTEIARKAFAKTTYRNSDGVAVAYPTNIVDFTTTFGEAEAVGPLNEMGLMSTFSVNPEVKSPIENGPSNYDPTLDVSQKDLLANYLTFSVVTKPATAVLSITWRLTF